MKKQKSVEVWTGFKFDQDWHETNDALIALAEKMGGEHGDSGAGFGIRDICFTFKNAELAKEFMVLAKKKFKSKTLTASIS